jgi:hypothetical protein
VSILHNLISPLMMVGHKRYVVERLTHAREQGGSIHLPGLPICFGVFYEKPNVYVKKIANAKTASVNHAQRHFVRSGAKNVQTRYENHISCGCMPQSCYSFANFPAFLRS